MGMGIRRALGRGRVWLAAAAGGLVVAAALTAGPRGAVRADDDGPRVFLPLAWLGVAREALPTAPSAAPVPSATAVAPTEPPTAEPASPTATEPPPPTEPPTATETAVPPTEPPTPTPKAPAGRIKGRLTDNGKPLAEGFGEPGLPQIELRKQSGGGAWEKVANSVTDRAGAFVFESPPALAPGEVYRVWWNNPTEDGADLWVHRWWSRDITAFGDGTDVDVGVFELADLKLTQPCHDCLQTAPITFGWRARSHTSESYRWSVFDGCGDVENRANAFRTASLGRKTEYTTSPPSGFRYDARYCWYVLIEDGANGTGWPFHDRRVQWCSSPETCRGLNVLGNTLLRVGRW